MLAGLVDEVLLAVRAIEDVCWQTLLSAFVILTILLVSAWTLYTSFLHPLSDIPGPFWASFSRYWLGSLVTTGRADQIQRVLHTKYGPLVRIAPDEVSISDPSAVRTIYSVKSGFTKTDFYPPFAAGVSPQGDLFTMTDEAKHAARRRPLSHVYSMSTVLESEECIDRCIDVFLGKMAKFAAEKRSIDLADWVHWYTFDVIGELFFGKQFGFMQNEHDFDSYIHTLETLVPGIALSCILPPYLRRIRPLVEALSPRLRAATREFEKIRAYGRSWVSRRMDEMAQGTARRSGLLDKFFEVREKTPNFDIPEIHNEATVAILAGSDTTAIAIRSILYHIMKNPVIYNKLVAEIDEAERAGHLSTPYIKYNEATKLPYLVACCKEGMRIHPSVGLSLPRYVSDGGAVLAGRFFPAGTKVGIYPAVIHFNHDVFGADAAVFNPDRWLGDPEAAARMDRHMLHFGGGSRTCLGKNIALAEIHKMVPNVLRSYRLQLVEPEREWTTRNFWFHTQYDMQTYVTAR